MQTKRPIWNLSWSPGNLRILPRNLRRVGLASSQKVKIEYTANDVIFQRSTITILANLDVHAGRAEEKDCVRAAGGTVLEIDGVAAVQVCALRNTIRVARPQRTCRIHHIKPEGLRVLAEAVDVRIVG